MAERLIRTRGSVGRRIWRRRRRKTGPKDLGGGHSDADARARDAAQPKRSDLGSIHAGLDDAIHNVHAVHAVHAHEGDLSRGLEGASAAATPVQPAARAPRQGLFARLKSLLGAGKGPTPAVSVASSMDPARDPAAAVLAVPRGVARLDAFERAVSETPPDSPAFRPLALAFHKELRVLSEGAGIDLALLERRVEQCARALVAAGEDEHAGNLLLRLGRRHQAAALFVSAGAIDSLEETYAQIRWDEGGARHEARLAFERFESLFLVHMRGPALQCLERALSLWGDNPVFAEVHQAFLARLGTPWRLALTSGADGVRIVGQWPLVIGRGEDAAVRLSSPLLARAHAQLELVGAAPVLVDLAGRGTTRVAGDVVRERLALPHEEVELDLGGVRVQARPAPGGLWLWPALAPAQRTLAVIAPPVQLPQPARHEALTGVRIAFDAHGRAMVEPPALLHLDALRRPTLLLQGDKLSLPGEAGAWTVVKPE